MCQSIHDAVNTWINCSFFYINCRVILAVSTRPPDGDLSRFALEFSRRLRASVRIFISTHQVAAATALLLLLVVMLMTAWFCSPGGAGMNSLYRTHR